MGFIRDVRKGFLFFRRDADPTPEEAALIERTLTGPEREVFFRMDLPDQRHSLRVTRLCMEGLKRHPELDSRVIIKAALLHDVGKIGAGLTLPFRTLWVLGHKVAPGLLDRVAERGAVARPGSLLRRMYIQLHHAEIGASLLEQLGTEREVCELIASTSEEPSADDPLPKRLLLAADGDCVVDWDES